jgi:hypothetical protein
VVHIPHQERSNRFFIFQIWRVELAFSIVVADFDVIVFKAAAKKTNNTKNVVIEQNLQYTWKLVYYVCIYTLLNQICSIDLTPIVPVNRKWNWMGKTVQMIHTRLRWLKKSIYRIERIMVLWMCLVYICNWILLFKWCGEDVNVGRQCSIRARMNHGPRQVYWQ